jgi:hypothetical protein
VQKFAIREKVNAAPAFPIVESSLMAWQEQQIKFGSTYQQHIFIFSICTF